MLSAFVGPAFVGAYNLCVRMLGLPIQLIGNAISVVFQQKATEEYNNSGNFKNIFVNTFKSLGLISVPVIIIIMFFGPLLFELIFGEEWRESGVLAQILILMFVLKLIVSPLSYAYYIKSRLKEDMIIHILILLSNFAVFKISLSINDNFYLTLVYYSIVNSFFYMIYFVRSFQLSKL